MAPSVTAGAHTAFPELGRTGRTISLSTIVALDAERSFADLTVDHARDEIRLQAGVPERRGHVSIEREELTFAQRPAT